MTGFQSIHQRMDDRDRFTAERHREVIVRISRLEAKRKNGNGNGSGLTMHYLRGLAVLGLLIAGTLGHMAPGAFRSAVSSLVNKILMGLASIG